MMFRETRGVGRREPSVVKLRSWFFPFRALSVLLMGFIAGCSHQPSLHHTKDSPVIKKRRESFVSGGRRIAVESFLPVGLGRHPPVLVLYGSGGAVVGKDEMTALAELLAQHGFASFVVHYFDRTGTLVTGDKGINKHWKEWLETVGDGVNFVATHPRVNPQSIGMFGYSLGAYMAIGQGIRDTRIRAVVEKAGGVFEDMQGHGKRFPPMLVLHGSADQRVPVTRVTAVKNEAKRFGTAPQIKIYEGEAHGFSPSALQDGVERTLKFFQQQLR